MARKKRTSDIVIRCLFFLILGAGALWYSQKNFSDYNDVEKKKKVCVMKVDSLVDNVVHNKITEKVKKEKYKHGKERTVSENYKLSFTYEVNGTQYSGYYESVGSPGYKEGDTFPIYCNPDDPTEWISSIDVDMQHYSLSDGYGLRKIGIILIGFGILKMIIYIIGNICRKSSSTQKGRN